MSDNTPAENETCSVRFEEDMYFKRYNLKVIIQEYINLVLEVCLYILFQYV